MPVSIPTIQIAGSILQDVVDAEEIDAYHCEAHLTCCDGHGRTANQLLLMGAV